MKHGGCYDCKEATQETLISTLDQELRKSVAVCDACLALRKAGAN